ncbi:MAG TPA: hypothetical protein DCS13_00245 [Candidatus Margulisbacteria bacterium]|nr:MAG: hypothetical protein A2X43_04765 [Candidatus Margulisbacteria bacterium GWD2_39_127]HAR61873.1 hypothetical protein [Candidatus Margulisiibacteriota bacterium]
MKSILLGYLKKYKLDASLIVGIGIMLIPICVFADAIPVDPDVPFYYNTSNGCFGVNNVNPEFGLDVAGDIKVQGINDGSIVLRQGQGNSGANKSIIYWQNCNGSTLFKTLFDNPTGKWSIRSDCADGIPGEGECLSAERIGGNINIPHGLNVGSASGAGTGCISLKNGNEYQPNIILTNTNGNSTCAKITFNKDGGSPAVQDEVGKIEFYQKNSSGTSKRFSRLGFNSFSVSSGNEQGAFYLAQQVNGVDTDVFKVENSIATLTGGLNVGTASGAGVGQIFTQAGVKIGNYATLTGADGELSVANRAYNSASTLFSLDFNGDSAPWDQPSLNSKYISFKAGGLEHSALSIVDAKTLSLCNNLNLTGGFNVGSANGAGAGVIRLKSIYSDMLIGTGPNNYDLFDIGFGAHADGGRFLLMMQGVTKVALNAYGTSTFSNGLNVFGNVGIGGITNPQYTLTVSGNVAARNFITSQAVWYDKVFSPTYNLMPLSELESYVQEHRHLPDVPEEKEVLKNGVNMSEFQGKLLQKVEELTLYVIEQDKKVAALQKENIELNKKNEKFESKVDSLQKEVNDLKKK